MNIPFKTFFELDAFYFHSFKEGHLSHSRNQSRPFLSRGKVFTISKMLCQTSLVAFAFVPRFDWIRLEFEKFFSGTI